MLIARGREDAACRPRERARADAIRRDGVPPVAIFLGADRLVHQTAVDPQVAGVEPVGCEQGGGEELFQQHDDRDLVAIGPVEAFEAVNERLLDVTRGDHDVRKIAVGRVQGELQVGLLGSGRQAG